MIPKRFPKDSTFAKILLMWSLYYSIQQKSVRYYSPFNKNVLKKTNGDRKYLKQQKSVEILLFRSRFASSVRGLEIIRVDIRNSWLEWKGVKIRQVSVVNGLQEGKVFFNTCNLVSLNGIMCLCDSKWVVGIAHWYFMGWTMTCEYQPLHLD